MKAEYNPFIPGEIENINKTKEKNDKLEEYFKAECDKWNKTTEPIYKTLMVDLTNPANMKTVINSQADTLTIKQNILEQINLYLNRRIKESKNLKMIRQEKLIFYAVGYSIKTNSSEKTTLMDGNLCEYQRTIELIDSHVDFLRNTNKNLETFQYSIKNLIDLANYLGR